MTDRRCVICVRAIQLRAGGLCDECLREFQDTDGMDMLSVIAWAAERARKFAHPRGPDLTGHKPGEYGRWTVLGESSSYEPGKRRVRCRCTCGREADVLVNSLTTHKSRGCNPCAAKDRVRTRALRA